MSALAAGKITSLTVQHNNAERVSVFIDGAFAFGAHLDVVAEFGLRVGIVLTEEERERIEEADALAAAKSIALGYLAHRARTEREIRTRLARSGFSGAVVDRVLARLFELGYVDDAAYARSFASGRFRNRGYGPARIRGDLLRKGVDRTLADETLGEVLEPEETLAAARAQAEKRWARLASEADPQKRRRKLADFLARRGFSGDTVRRVVEEIVRG